MIDQLRARWAALIDSLGVTGPVATEVLDDLLDRHAEPQRRYHSIEHLTEIHAALDLIADPAAGGLAVDGTEAGNDPAVRLAAWFHDAVHEPASGDNEARSGVLATGQLRRLGAPPSVVDLVAPLVEMTRTHRPVATDERGAALADADLSILGAPPDRYERYVRQVRAEYAHLDDVTWRSGRAAVLDGFLTRDPIYRTRAGRSAWEDRARRNLRAERERLDEP